MPIVGRAMEVADQPGGERGGADQDRVQGQHLREQRASPHEVKPRPPAPAPRPRGQPPDRYGADHPLWSKRARGLQQSPDQPTLGASTQMKPPSNRPSARPCGRRSCWCPSVAPGRHRRPDRRPLGAGMFLRDRPADQRSAPTSSATTSFWGRAARSRSTSRKPRACSRSCANLRRAPACRCRAST